MASSPSRRGCGGWTTRSGRARCEARCSTSTYPTSRRGRCRGCRPSRSARLGAAHRAGDPLQPRRADGRARPDPDGPDHGARGHLLITAGAGSSPESTVAPTWNRAQTAGVQPQAGHGGERVPHRARAGHRRGGEGHRRRARHYPLAGRACPDAAQPAVTAPIVGARSLAQLDDNLGVLDVRLDPPQQARLAEVSAIELGFPRGALRRLDLTR